jgi:hypothetical protein
VLLKTIASHGYSDVSPRQSFNYAHNCLGLLDDVRASLCELLPKLDGWSCWGPGYFHEVSEEGEEVSHYLAFTLAPSWRGSHPFFRGGLKFHEGTIQWSIANRPKKNDGFADEINHGIASISSKGVLDIEKMAKTMQRAAGKWQVV